MLPRIMGVTIYATSTVIASFMAGLALGSFLLGRFIDKRKDPLRIYAGLEFLIGLTAFIVPALLVVCLPILKYLFQVSGENQFLVTLARPGLSFLVLLIPTTMMGGTLPILTSWLVKEGILFGRSFSLLYSINTLGAVTGVAIGGFVTLGSLGETATLGLGAAINSLVAILAYGIFRKERRIEGGSEKVEANVIGLKRRISLYSDQIRRVVLVAFIISGFTALAYEVIWTRNLILFLKTSIYAFSGMLTIFLLGIALGSFCMKGLVDRLTRPLLIFGILELLVGFFSIISLYLFPFFDGHWGSQFRGLERVLIAPFVIVFPLTFLLGMIFPIASVCYARDDASTGASVGLLYSANTVGSILGALLAGFWLIPHWGSTNSVVLLVCLNFSLGLLLLWLESGRALITKVSCLTVLLLLGIFIVMVKSQDPLLLTITNKVESYKKSVCGDNSLYEIYYNKEGIEGTVTAFSIFDRKQLWINGMGMTELCTETKLMAHLPLMFSKIPKELMVVCFGMGTTTKSAALYADINITVIELVQEVYDIFGYYHDNGKEILQQKNVHPLVNDGRNYLLLSPRKYDVITVDPAPPIWSAGTVNLYTREFFQICRDRLSADGVMCLWFPGATTEDEVKSILRTFHAVFPHTKVYRGPHNWGYYLIGTKRSVIESDFRSNVEKAFQNQAMVNDLAEYDKVCVSPDQLYQLLLWDTQEVEKIAQEGVLITDDYPYTEFFLWRYLRGRMKEYNPQSCSNR
ncbi:MAG: fused MFS/spermidine synthase [Deltaproteobacteria bacterium]|nr:fused MFS/spermidine synthase [Deltaproteobacteria bacterium]